uniref:ABC transporter family G domain-containing protein n=2 Tax=Fagus sylvatica TaxID=28930 RepID=A0A2N9F197_FAGSY
MLDGIKDALVCIPRVTGISNEQCKRLTIAVELVVKPSIIFMDEPTGLDEQLQLSCELSDINLMKTCMSIEEINKGLGGFTFGYNGEIMHSIVDQPDYKNLILLKTGGHLIYSGPLGQHSSSVIEYFESIPGVQKIRNNYNPATWMLEVTSTSAEAELGVDFALKYRESALYESNFYAAEFYHSLAICSEKHWEWPSAMLVCPYVTSINGNS